MKRLTPKVRLPQIGLRYQIPLVLSMLARRAFNPHGLFTYSQFGEDRLLCSLFQGIENGVYVDVGCNDPIAYSNTFALYLRGWAGLTVDASQEVIDRHKRVRSRDHSICTVVSDEAAPVDFYHPFATTLTGGVGKKTSGPWARTEQTSYVTRMLPRRLDSLLIEHAIKAGFELLCIDIEGHELHALRSIDLALWRPKVIVVEIHGLDMTKYREHQTCSHVIEAGYQLLGYFPPNAFFVSPEFSMLLGTEDVHP